MAIADATKLWIYNDALNILGSRQIASLTEDREPRRVLDSAWGSNNQAVLLALEQGDWNFATRAMKLDYDSGLTTEFGFSRVFAKPSDMRRLTILSSDEWFKNPLTHSNYLDEAGYWYSDLDVMYAKIVSDDTDYGLDSSRWTQSFQKYLAGYLAFERCERLTNSREKKADARAMMDEGLKGAKSLDAQSEGVKFPPPGSWVRSRGGMNLNNLGLKAR